MTIQIPLPDLQKWPTYWNNFIDHCQAVKPDEEYIEQYVYRVLMDQYYCVIDDASNTAIFNDDGLYTLFMLEWS